MKDRRLLWRKIAGGFRSEGQYGTSYSIYRKGRRFWLVYCSGRSGLVTWHGPYTTAVGAKRSARRQVDRWQQ